jgi:hypothetical protein
MVGIARRWPVLLQLLPLEATKVSQVQAGRSHYTKRARLAKAHRAPERRNFCLLCVC